MKIENVISVTYTYGPDAEVPTYLKGQGFTTVLSFCEETQGIPYTTHGSIVVEGGYAWWQEGETMVWVPVSDLREIEVDSEREAL